MKKIINNLLYVAVITIIITLLFSCSNDLSRNEAKKLITEKYKLPSDDNVNFNCPTISIWTPGGCWGTVGIPPSISLIENIMNTGKYSSNESFLTNNPEGVYFAKGDFELFKKYKEIQYYEYLLE